MLPTLTYQNEAATFSTAAPILTVVTIARNAQAVLPQNLGSFLLQTSIPGAAKAYEHVFVVAPSTDGTVDLIRAYAMRAPHPVRLFVGNDRGIAHAFNIGQTLALGEWVWFLNADDFLFDDSVMTEVVAELRALAESDSLLLGGITQYIDASLTALLEAAPPRFDRLDRGMYVPHPSLIARRKLFDRVGGFSESFSVGMDYEWALRVWRRVAEHDSRTYTTVNREFAFFRKGGASARHETRAWLDLLAAHVLHSSMTHAATIYMHALSRALAVRLLPFLRRNGTPQTPPTAVAAWIRATSNPTHD